MRSEYYATDEAQRVYKGPEPNSRDKNKNIEPSTNLITNDLYENYQTENCTKFENTFDYYSKPEFYVLITPIVVNQHKPYVRQPTLSLQPYMIDNSNTPSNLNKSSAQAPNLVRIGCKAPTSLNTSNYNSHTTQNTQKPIQPVTYISEDENLYARRLRNVLLNQQKKVLTPSIKLFNTEADVITHLLPFHLYQQDPDILEDNLKLEQLKYDTDSVRLAHASNDLIQRLDRLSSNKLLLTTNDDILLMKLFLKTKQVNLYNDRDTGQGIGFHYY
ncbi:hypothetical protein HZS_248 [Henneguya salminicola]|nr:hypothetical protein HZS_248 [Henneguya salminicola]